MYLTILNWLFANLDDFQYFYIDNLCGPRIVFKISLPQRLLKKELTGEDWYVLSLKP